MRKVSEELILECLALLVDAVVSSTNAERKRLLTQVHHHLEGMRAKELLTSRRAQRPRKRRA